MATLQSVIADAQTLSDADKEQVRAALPYPNDQGALGRLWLFLIGGLLILAILAGLAAFIFFGADNSGAAAAFLAICTTIVGALIGLFAPSPVKG
jgi:predicted lipid-binding transport protein (Tim44 family)